MMRECELACSHKYTQGYLTKDRKRENMAFSRQNLRASTNTLHEMKQAKPHFKQLSR